MKERIVTGIIAATLFMIPFVIGGYWFTCVTIILAVMAYYEFSRMIKIRIFNIKWLIGLIGIVLLFSSLLNTGWEEMQIKVLLALIISLLTLTVFNEAFSIEKSGILLIGVLYIGFGFESLAEARIENGIVWTLAILLSIWASDSGAYFIGKKFGKRKLAEKISPNKTIEGAVGGILTALVFGITLQLTINPYGDLVEAIIITFFVSIAGQLGDLIESALKRNYSVKDSGKILPGHGGILDRSDSWIFVFTGLTLIGFI